MDIMILDTPTPQRMPILKRLEEIARQPMHVYYLYDHDFGRGWGDVDVGTGSVLKSLRKRWALARDLRSPDLRVVCLFGYRGWIRIFAAMTARLRGARVVVRSDSNIRDEAERPRWRRLAKRVYLRLILGDAEVWTIGSANARYWSALGFHRQVLIPYTVPILPRRSQREAELTSNWLNYEFVVAYVGRLERAKGLEDLLAAWASFRVELPGARAARLVICGSGPLKRMVQDFAANSRMDCDYLGSLEHSQLGSVYANCNVVVVPSRAEPWGLVVNEALGYGARVIASDRVGAADDLINAGNGRRFQAADIVALTDCLRLEYYSSRQRVTPPPALDIADLMHDALRSKG